MSDFILFAQNLLESATVTGTSSATGKPLTRLYDRDRGPQWQATTTAQQDIDVDLGSAQAVNALAIVGQTLGAGLQLFSGSAPPAATLVTSGTATLDPTLFSFTAVVARYWRVRLLTSATVAALGEVFLGGALTFELPPFLDSAQPGTIGNVRRDRSPAGYRWAVKRGEARRRFPYRWTGMSDADLVRLELAYAQCDQGAKALLIQDELGIARWVSWESDQIQPVAIVGGELYEVPDMLFETAL